MIASRLINACDSVKWRAELTPFLKLDVCHMPEYHMAYASMSQNSIPLMWVYEDRGLGKFVYPFLMTEIFIPGLSDQFNKRYFDISSVYGYSGALSTNHSIKFLSKAWEAFDLWCEDKGVIVEFSRLSTYCGSEVIVHPNAKIQNNREIAVITKNSCSFNYLMAIDSKTRNMVSKAVKQGLIVREEPVMEKIEDFKGLYYLTMERNTAEKSFYYTKEYFKNLLQYPLNEINLYAAYSGGKMVSAAIALICGEYALYHLGATHINFLKFGATNLVISEMVQSLCNKGVSYINLGGGRTTLPDDPLLRFKKSCAISSDNFKIGSRVINTKIYNELVSRWDMTGRRRENKIIFYR